jgi:hypothetical protein
MYLLLGRKSRGLPSSQLVEHSMHIRTELAVVHNNSVTIDAGNTTWYEGSFSNRANLVASLTYVGPS